MKKTRDLVELHNRIVAYRATYPFDKRDEYLRGWERALRCVLDEEEPPKLEYNWSEHSGKIEAKNHEKGDT